MVGHPSYVLQADVYLVDSSITSLYKPKGRPTTNTNFCGSHGTTTLQKHRGVLHVRTSYDGSEYSCGIYQSFKTLWL